MFTLEMFVHNISWFLLMLNLGNRLKYLGVFVINLYCCNFKSVFPEPHEKLSKAGDLRCSSFGGRTAKCFASLFEKQWEDANTPHLMYASKSLRR